MQNATEGTLGPTAKDPNFFSSILTNNVAGYITLFNMSRDLNSLLSLQEVSGLLGVHTETLRRWDRDGKLSAIKVNDRGDRRYRYGDVIKILGSYGTIGYKEFKIAHYSPGFEMFPDRFGSIAKFVVSNKKVVAGFAFAVAGLKLFAEPDVKSQDLENLALSKIKNFIDQKRIKNFQEYTFEFEFKEQGFTQVKNPDWWTNGSL